MIYLLCLATTAASLHPSELLTELSEQVFKQDLTGLYELREGGADRAMRVRVLQDWTAEQAWPVSKQELARLLKGYNQFERQWEEKMVDKLMQLLGYTRQSEQFQQQIRNSPEQYFLTYDMYRTLV